MAPSPASISPLAPGQLADMPAIDGVRIATGAAGVKYKGRTDVMAMIFDEPAVVAGVFTRSRCPSAAVDFCRANLAVGKARIVVVNSGNANAFTGCKGVATTTRTAELAAAAAGCSPSEVFLASTGVIGEPLDAEKFAPVLRDAAKVAVADGWRDAARAIMTTDTYPKVATATAKIDSITVTINGIAKGAGMIQPDMATMLSFVATDAPLSQAVLQTVLSREVGPSFNAISIDSDTSTSDTLMAFATGRAAERGCPAIDDPKDRRLAGFRKAFAAVLRNLATQVVRDGEGARKQVEITVTGAASARSAKRVAFAIANSPLVKT
ncbi:MAG TPA: bifunctional glutamate N-acetyltransferase/amino-acid acetyltransferase ArgJ, partial [Rhizobiaceae bacterium]|nr:bifunctional glutamate N-acetyltransferase/amino-acid acetyltransferase ArgJ [Rhizobiaceae bacterium]